MAKNKQPAKKNTKPSQYDWFKNGSQPTGKAAPKGSLKVVWKFVKIFLFISLFGFTMTGCIQSFVFKTDTSVGRSVEIYANKDEVAPHSTTINVTHDSKNKSDIYLNITDQNHWVNEREHPGVLKSIREEVKIQGNNLHMKDAWHGSNEILRVLHDGKVDKKTDSILQLGNKPMVISSKATKYKALTSNTLDLSFIKLWSEKHKQVEAISFHLPKTKVGDKVAKARDAFNTNLLDTLLKEKDQTGKKEIIKEALTVSGDVIKEIKGTRPVTPSPKYLKAEKELNRVTKNFELIRNLFHLNFNTKTNSFDMQSGFIINSGARSAWRPLVTWGDAWHLGPFYALFVYPIGYVTANMIKAMPFMDGWESLLTIFIVVFVIKALSFLITFKSILQQTKMQELSAKKAVIDAKYANYKDNKQMQQRKNQEVQALYKKEGISPFGAMGAAFIVMPLFFSILRVTYALPHLKSTEWLGMRFGATSWKELFHGSWQYLPLMVLAVGFAAIQQLLPRLLTRKRDKNRINVHQKAAMKKSNKTQNIMIIVSIVASVLFSAGMQVYYLASGSWMIIQAFLTHHILVKQKKNRRIKKVKV